MRVVRLAAALTCVACVARASAAQETRSDVESSMDGILSTADGRPVADAEVTLLGLGVARTDSAGRFGFRGAPPGTFLVRAQRLGFSPIMKAVVYDGTHTQHVSLRFGESATLLAPVVVRDSAASMRIVDGFERRRRTGQGFYLSESDLTERHIRSVEQLLWQVPGVQVDTAGVVRMDRGIVSILGDNCYRGAQVLIDGTEVSSDYNLRNLRAVSIRGIEVYRGVATTPAELRSSRMACGTIAIWTK